jgi:hypothetical protein
VHCPTDEGKRNCSNLEGGDEIMFHVVIKKWENDEVVEQITKAPVPRLMAERIEGGININLNHDKYYTEIIEAKEVAT